MPILAVDAVSFAYKGKPLEDGTPGKMGPELFSDVDFGLNMDSRVALGTYAHTTYTYAYAHMHMHICVCACVCICTCMCMCMLHVACACICHTGLEPPRLAGLGPRLAGLGPR